jgi:hypothetical protein
MGESRTDGVIEAVINAGPVLVKDFIHYLAVLRLFEDLNNMSAST